MYEDASAGYRQFWTQLLGKANERTNLHARVRPGNEWWIGAVRRGISYNYALRKDSAYVELWIDRGDEKSNDALFRYLIAHKDEIEKTYGQRLVWHVARGRSRAVQFLASRYGFDDRQRWPEIQVALIEAMVRLEAAFRAYLHGEQPRPAAQTPFSVQGSSGLRPVESGRVVTVSNLRAGIAEFKRRWPAESDFNSRLYEELRALRDAGTLSWGRVVDVLAAWRALRTRLPGRDRWWYLERGEDPFRRMLAMVDQILARHAGRDPDLDETDPEELRELFDVALGIKGTSSPVFASKLCHFLVPSAFPVADQDMLGISSVEGYWQYWRACAQGWHTSEEKAALKAELQSAMCTTAFPGYPWAAKITELCHSGARCGGH